MIDYDVNQNTYIEPQRIENLERDLSDMTLDLNLPHLPIIIVDDDSPLNNFSEESLLKLVKSSFKPYDISYFQSQKEKSPFANPPKKIMIGNPNTYQKSQYQFRRR